MVLWIIRVSWMSGVDQNRSKSEEDKRHNTLDMLHHFHQLTLFELKDKDCRLNTDYISSDIRLKKFHSDLTLARGSSLNR